MIHCFVSTWSIAIAFACFSLPASVYAQAMGDGPIAAEDAPEAPTMPADELPEVVSHSVTAGSTIKLQLESATMLRFDEPVEQATVRGPEGLARASLVNGQLVEVTGLLEGEGSLMVQFASGRSETFSLLVGEEMQTQIVVREITVETVIEQPAPRNPIDVDIDKLSGTLESKYTHWSLTINYRVKIDNQADDEKLFMVVYVRHDAKRLVRDRKFEPIGHVIVLDPKAAGVVVEEDGDRIYTGSDTIRFPFFAFRSEGSLRLAAFCYSADGTIQYEDRLGSLRIVSYRDRLAR